MTLGGRDLEAIIEKDGAMASVADQLAAWGIDHEEWAQVAGEITASMAARYEKLPLEMALQLAWGGGFLIGYAARIEVETRELHAKEDAELIGHDRDALDAVRAEALVTCPRCGGDTTDDDLTYSGCSGCREQACPATEAGDPCKLEAGHDGPHEWLPFG